MKTLISDTPDEIVYEFSFDSSSRLCNYSKTNQDPVPDYDAISTEEYNRWLVWLGVSE